MYITGHVVRVGYICYLRRFGQFIERFKQSKQKHLVHLVYHQNLVWSYGPKCYLC